MYLRVCSALTYACLVMLLSACGSSGQSADTTGAFDVATQVSLSMGPEGGTLALPGGATLEVPEGALATEVTLSVMLSQPPEIPDFTAVGSFFQFAPDGQEFAVPLVLRIPVETSMETLDPARLAVVWKHGDESWKGLPTALKEEDGQYVLIAGIRRFSGGGAGQWHDGQGACCEGDDCRYMELEECLGTPVGPGVPCQLGASPTCELLRCCAGQNGQYWQQEEVTCIASSGDLVEQTLCEPVCCLNGANADVLSRGYCLDQGGNAHDDPAGCQEVCCVGDLSAGYSEVQVTLAMECDEAERDAEPVGLCDTVCCRSEIFGGGTDAFFFEEMLRLQCLDEEEGTTTDDVSQCEEICCQLVEQPVQIEDFQVMTRGTCLEAAGYAVLGPAEACEEICCQVDDLHELLTLGECTQYGGQEDLTPDACQAVCCHTPDGDFVSNVGSNCVGLGGEILEDSHLCDEVCCLADDIPLTMSAGECQNKSGVEESAQLCADAVCCVVGPNDASVETSIDCAALDGAAEPVEFCQTVCCSGPGVLTSLPAVICSNLAGAMSLTLDMCDEVCCFVDANIKEEGGYLEAAKAMCVGQEEGGFAGEVAESSQCLESCCLYDGVPISMATGTCSYLGGEVVAAQQCEQICCELPEGDPQILAEQECLSAGGNIHNPSACLESCCVTSFSSILAWQLECSAADDSISFPPDYCESVCCFVDVSDPVLSSYETVLKHQCVAPKALPAGTAQTLAEAELCDYVCCAIEGSVGTLDKGSCLALGGAEQEAATCDTVEEICCALSLEEVTMAQPLDCALLQGQAHPEESCTSICCKATQPGDVTAAWEDMATLTCDALDGIIEDDATLCQEVCCDLNDETQKLVRGICLEQGGSVLDTSSQCSLVCCELLDGTALEMTTAACTDAFGEEVSSELCQAVCCDTLGSFLLLTASQCQGLFGDVADDPTSCDEVCCLDVEAVAAALVSRGECAPVEAIYQAPDCDTVCCQFEEDGHMLSGWEQKALCLHALGGATSDFTSCAEICCALDGSFVMEFLGTCVGLGGAAEPDETKCEDICCLTGDQLAPMSPWACQDANGTAFAADVCSGTCCTDGTYFEKSPEGESCSDYMFDLAPVPAGEADQCQIVCCVVDGQYGSEYKGNCIPANGATMEPDASMCAPVCCHHDGSWQLVEPYVCAEDGGDPVLAQECEPVCCDALQTTLTLPAGQCAAFGGTQAEDATLCDKVCCDWFGSLELTGEDDCLGEVVAPENCGLSCCQADDETYLTTPASCAIDNGEIVSLASCEPGCCLVENVYMELPTAMCQSPAGTSIADATLCQEICCAVGGAALYETAGTCAIMGGVIEQDNTLCEQDCCIKEQSASLVPPDECLGDDVIATEIAGYCGTYCCQTESGFFLELAYACIENLGGAVPLDPLACSPVCCHHDQAYFTTELGACKLAGGSQEADSSLCLKVCCDTEGSFTWKSAAECAQSGGQEAADVSFCPATNCDQVVGDSEAVGALAGSLAALTDDNGITQANCPDNYDTDPNKTSGPDLVVQLTIPANGCVAAKGVLMGANPALYVMDACGNVAPACHLSNYGNGSVEAVYPSIYPFPKPTETRKTALLYCNTSDQELTVAVWLDSGTDQTAPLKGPMPLKMFDEPQIEQDFTFHWEVFSQAPINNVGSGAEPLSVDVGEPLGSFKYATDDYQVSACPTLADGSGSGGADLFYSFTPDQSDDYLVSLDLLNPDINSIWKSSHFMVLLDDQGQCLWAATGETTLNMKEPLVAGKTYTIVVDADALGADTLFELTVAPYQGPEEDDCANALVIDALPKTISGTTTNAFDNVVSAGDDCLDLIGGNQGLGQPDVIYAYTPAVDTVVQITLDSDTDGFEPNLIVSEECAGKMIEPTCFDAVKLDGESSVSITVQLAANQSYWIIVDGGSGFADVGEGNFTLTLEEGGLTEPDTCAKATPIPGLPFEVVLNGRNLSDDFSGVGNQCPGAVCCKTGEIYSISTWCEGVVADDWSKCETVCCDQGEIFSEELRGNCEHYGGNEECVAKLPVSCCQIMAMPQIAYVYAQGCGMPLQGGIQGTPVASEYCDQVCCEGYGYQKRGNCENFGAVSHPFPVSANSCSYSGDTAGEGGFDAVFKYTATEPGLLIASRVWGSGEFKYLYGVVDSCSEGTFLGCDTTNPQGTKAVLPLEAGQTGYIIVDGWIEGEVFKSYKVKFDWLPGLPANGDCNSAEEVGQIPYLVSGSLANAGNSVVVADSPNCSGMTHTSNGLDTLYSFDPGGLATDLIAGVISADFSPLLYAVSTCNAPLPLWEECLQSSKSMGYVKPLVHLQNVTDPVTFVVDSVVGDPWGSYQFALLEATAPINDTCQSAIVVDSLPYNHVGHTIGSSNSYGAPAQTCQFTNWSDVGAGPDALFKFQITPDFVDQYDGFKAQISGTTFYTQFWVMAGSCTSDGSTCLRATGTSYQFNGAWDYQVGDVFYFVVDGSNADSQGMYMVDFEGI